MADISIKDLAKAGTDEIVEQAAAAVRGALAAIGALENTVHGAATTTINVGDQTFDTWLVGMGALVDQLESGLRAGKDAIIDGIPVIP